MRGFIMPSSEVVAAAVHLLFAFTMCVAAAPLDAAIRPAGTNTAVTPLDLPIIHRLLSLDKGSSALARAADAYSSALHRAAAAAIDPRDDFFIINSLLSDMVLALPDASITKASIDIFIESLECRDIYVHDIGLSHNNKIDQEQQVDLRLRLEVDLMCNFDWRYSYDAPGFLGVLSDDGQGQIFTENNEMATTVSFASSDFDTLGPTSSTVEDCASAINVVDMKFDGGISAAIADVFEFAVRGIVEKEISDVLCEELGALGDVISDKLLNIKQIVEPYLDEENSAPNNPLSAQQLFDSTTPNGIELFDFASTDSIINSGVDVALKEVDKRLGEVVRDDNGRQDLGVNVLVRSFLLDDDGYVTIPLDRTPVYRQENVFMFEEASIAIKSIRIKGLDTFTRIEALDVIGAQTLQNRLAMKSLEIEAEVDLGLRTSDEAFQVVTKDEDGSDNPSVSETLVLKASLRNLDAVVALFAAIDQGKFGDLQLGSLLRASHIPQCVLSALHGVELTQLHLAIGDMDPPTIESLSSDGLSRVTTAAFEAITAMYEDLFLEALPAIFDDTLRPLFNEMVRKYLGDGPRSGCPSLPDMTDDDPIIDMRDLLLQPEDAAAAGGLGTSPYGTVAGMLKSLVDDALLAPNEKGELPLNDLVVGPLTKLQSGAEGSFVMPGDIFNEAVAVNIADLKGMMQFGVFDVSLTGVDSITGPVEFLEPDGTHVLNNGATFGGPPKSVRLSAGILLALGGEKQSMRNVVRISFEFTSVELFAAILMKMDRRSLMQFPLRDTLNPYCWLATMPAPELSAYGVRVDGDHDVSLALNEIRAVVQRMKLNVECVSCSSPGLQEWSDLLSTPQAIDDATDVFNMILNYGTGLLDGGFVQVLVDRLLNVAAASCPSSPLYGMQVPAFKAFEAEQFSDDSSGNFFLAVGIVAAILAVGITLFVFGFRFYVRRRHRAWIKTLSSQEIRRLMDEQLYEKEQSRIADSLSTSMATSQSIPFYVRILIPIVILGNVALFLSGHLSLGGTIMIAFQLGEQDLSIDSFYDFSILDTVVEMWNAGARAMAILIAIFSGLWPYTKQITTFVLWFLPPTWVSSNKRGKIFAWLDALGKYSFIDIFVLIVAMVAFRVSISSPSVAFLPENLYSVDLILVALWGLYANATAQILSQLSSHVIIHYHGKTIRDALMRRAERNCQPQTPVDIEQVQPEDDDSNCGRDTDDNEDHDESPTRLCKHIFSVGDHKPDKRLQVKSFLNAFIVFLSLAVTVTMIVGCIIPAFHFELLGLVGVVVEAGQKFDRAIAYYSIFSIARNLIGQAIFLGKPAQFFGLGLLSVILILTALIMPLVLVTLYLRLWLAKLTRKQMERTLFRIEIIKSWQYVEVFILSVIVAAWQVGGLSAGFVNEYCSVLDGIFAALSQFNFLDTEDAQCFYVRSSVESGTYFLMAGALFLAILSLATTKAAAQKLHENNVAARRDCMSKSELISSWRSADDVMSTADESPEAASDTGTDISEIDPVPVHFTDIFGCFLARTTVTSTCRSKSNTETSRTVYDLGESEDNVSSSAEEQSMH